MPLVSVNSSLARDQLPLRLNLGSRGEVSPAFERHGEQWDLVDIDRWIQYLHRLVGHSEWSAAVAPDRPIRAARILSGSPYSSGAEDRFTEFENSTERTT